MSRALRITVPVALLLALMAVLAVAARYGVHHVVYFMATHYHGRHAGRLAAALAKVTFYHG